MVNPYPVRSDEGCTNSCTFCGLLWARPDADKDKEEILSEIKKNCSRKAVLQCNFHNRPDAREIVKRAKSMGKELAIRANAPDLCGDGMLFDLIPMIDEVQINLVSMKPEIHESIAHSRFEDFLTGAAEIERLARSVVYHLLLTMENLESINYTLDRLKGKNIVIEVLEPHPKIYSVLSGIDGYEIIDRPEEVKLELTGNCNLDCMYCFNKNSGIKSMGDMPLATVKGAIDEMAASGIRNLKLSGGEPLTRADIADITRHAVDAGLRTIINTNGKLLDSAMIKRLKGSGTGIFMPVNPGDDLAGFASVVKSLLDAGFTVSANSLISKRLITDFEEMDDTVRGLGIGWFLVRPVPVDKVDRLSSEDVGIIMGKMIQADGSSIKVDGLPFCSYYPAIIARFSTGSIACGIYNKMVIDPAGNIKPCYSISESAAKIGEVPILEAWNRDSMKRWRYGRYLPTYCSSCIYLWECLAGCRFAARLFKGNYDSLDPLAAPAKYLRHSH